MSETSRRPFPCQSVVFVHCPLSSWLTRKTLSCKENNLNIWIKSLVEILELHNSICYFCPMNGSVVLGGIHEVCTMINQNTGRFQVRDQHKTYTVRWRTYLINPLCRMFQSSSTEVPGKPQQGCLECDIQLVSPEGRSIKGAVVTKVSAAMKNFPQLSLFSH